LVYRTISSSGISSNVLQHCYACHISISRKTVANANREKLINAFACARHANTNTDVQPNAVTATAEPNRNTHLHPAHGNSHVCANVDGQPHALTSGPNGNRNGNTYAACDNADPYINPTAKHRKPKPNHTGLLPLCSYWYGST
jgi:hypothetical protein